MEQQLMRIDDVCRAIGVSQRQVIQLLPGIGRVTAASVLGDLVEAGGEDVRQFRAAVLGGHVRPADSLLLTAAMSEARVAVDPAGNGKLAKGSQGGRRQRARDDAEAAAILGVAAGFRQWHTGSPRRRLRSALVG